MNFINRKDGNGNYVVSNEELKSLIKSLNKKYKLSTRSAESEFAYELLRYKDKVECIVARYFSDCFSMFAVTESCILTDFDISSILDSESSIRNIHKDYRKFMYSKFGDEYINALKQFKKKQKQQAIRNYANERNEQYQNEVDILR